MYTRYFGLTEKPFAIAPNPRFLYMSELHQEALAHLLYGVNGEGCIVLFTGGVGTGKTTVCRCLIEQLPSNTDLALVLNPRLSIVEFLKTICKELAIPVAEENPTGKDYIDALNTYLLSAHARGRNTLLIVDEAQHLDVEVLEELRMLTNLETDTQKLLQIVLVGQPELRENLKAPELAQINQRITARYHLEPLNQGDVSKYIVHRIAVAGGDPLRLFITEKAVRLIYKHSKGIPRLINVICDRALLGAYAESKITVDAAIAKKAIEEVTASQRKLFFRYPKIAVAVVILLIVLCIPAYFWLQGDGQIFGKQFTWPFTGDKTIERPQE